MLCMLIAYDASRNVVATLDHMAGRSADGSVIGLIDFDAHERGGGAMTEVWHVERAVGSKTWPEWLGSRAHDFRVELAGPPGQKRIDALVHKVSGYRRERAAIEAEIGRRVEAADRGAADIRDLVGGPDRPLVLDDQGRTLRQAAVGTADHLPLVRRAHEPPGAVRQ